MLRPFLIALSQSETARRALMGFGPTRRSAERFVAGDSIDDALQVARQLNQAGASVTLDYLGESVHTEAEARSAADIYLRLLDRIAAESLNANISLKLTQMGQDISDEFLSENVGRILERAREAGLFVRFDMEGFAYAERTMRFALQQHRQHGGVGPVIQSYLRKAEDYVAAANEVGMRVRLCKGAYREPPEIAYPDKSDVDQNYYRLALRLLADGRYPGFATHDEALIQRITNYVRKSDISASTFEFQMLYGVRRDLQLRLLEQGFNVRVYVPFGDAWYPYLMRRMAERPANLLFVARALLQRG